MKRNLLQFSAALLLMAGLASCGESTGTKMDETVPIKPDTTAVANTNKGPVSLFDGKSLKGWHSFNNGSAEVKNWIIEDSSMVCLGAAKDAHGGDIVSDKEYENFELTWDWKVSKGSNSGMMYHVIE